MFSVFELWPMEEGRQYSEYSVESNLRAYMTMRDYRNLHGKISNLGREIQTHLDP